jgi:hypothetical protein
MRKKPGCDGGFWLRSNDAVDKAAIFEDKHGGNTLYLKLRSGARILIDVQLRDAVSTICLRSQLLHNWSNHATRSTPGSPGVDKDWTIFAFQYGALKSRVGNNKRFGFVGSPICFAHVQRRPTLAALRQLLSGMARVDAILSSTIAASYYRHCFVLFWLREFCSMWSKCPAKVLRNNLAGSSCSCKELAVTGTAGVPPATWHTTQLSVERTIAF